MRDDDVGFFGEDQLAELPRAEDRGKGILRLEIELLRASAVTPDIELQLAAAGDDRVLPAVFDENTVESGDVTLDTALLHRRN